MLKVSVVLPGTGVDLNALCPHCRRFVITKEVLKNADTFRAWWKGFGLKKSVNSSEDSHLDSNYQEYLAFLTRIVGSMHVRTIGLSPWKKIMGATYNQPISTGFTEREPDNYNSGARKNKNRQVYRCRIDPLNS